MKLSDFGLESPKMHAMHQKTTHFRQFLSSASTKLRFIVENIFCGLIDVWWEVNLLVYQTKLWDGLLLTLTSKVWGSSSGTFNPGRHLNDDGSFVKPSSPKFHSFGMGPRLWFVHFYYKNNYLIFWTQLTITIDSPGAQLGTYEFVAVWSTLLPYLDIVPLQIKERTIQDSFTSTMDGNFLVKISRI